MTHYEENGTQNETTPQAEPIAYPSIRFANGTVLRGWGAVVWRQKNHGSFRPLTYWIKASLKMEHGGWLELASKDGKTYVMQRYNQYTELTAGIVSVRIPNETITKLYASPESDVYRQFHIPDQASIVNAEMRRVWRSGWVCADTLLPVGYEFDCYLDDCAEEACSDDYLSELLDDCYSEVEICGITFTASQILQELDSCAWDAFAEEERARWREDLLSDEWREEELAEVMDGKYIFIDEDTVERLTASQEVE